MVDLEPFLEAPFEEASNLSFEALLGVGVALLAAVAVFGRSTVTQLAVIHYILSIPVYVGYRSRVWEGDGETESDGDDRADSDDCDGSADTEAESDRADGAGNGSPSERR
ncbi:hypothetical protein [Haloterrigena salinisoli]|uniref:hypothetical protein n=1 Tax=Haloterrigena salinisoli TaxID=3132747 RepID=UPI0030D0AD70